MKDFVHSANNIVIRTVEGTSAKAKVTRIFTSRRDLMVVRLSASENANPFLKGRSEGKEVIVKDERGVWSEVPAAELAAEIDGLTEALAWIGQKGNGDRSL